MEKTVDLICLNCGTGFVRRLAEHKRSQQLSRREFCCPECSKAWQHEHLPPTNPSGNLEALALADPANRRDEYTPFRYFLRNCRSRKGKECNIDLAYLKMLWVEQGGHCPLTGWALLLPRGSAGFDNGEGPRNASIDRIDHSQGYIKGNVRYVALIVNLARHNWNDGIIMELAQSIVDYAGIK